MFSAMVFLETIVCSLALKHKSVCPSEESRNCRRMRAVKQVKWTLSQRILRGGHSVPPECADSTFIRCPCLYDDVQQQIALHLRCKAVEAVINNSSVQHVPKNFRFEMRLTFFLYFSSHSRQLRLILKILRKGVSQFERNFETTPTLT